MGRLGRIVVLAGLWLLAACTAPARAWNGTGHMTVADIAYDHLTPRTKAAVDALLLRHRDYSLWMSEMPAGDTDRARFAFMKAATWPDDIRKTPDDRPVWHYVDLPVVAPGYAADPLLIQPVKPNALTQLPTEEAVISDKAASDGDRAIALCWVEHLVGDVHQPLHDASLFSAFFPKGDKGGNSELLAAGAVDGDPVESEAHPHTLHALWDDAEGDSRDPADILKIAARLEAPAFGRGTYPQIARHTDAAAWAAEGNALARDVAYAGGKIALTPDGAKADVTLPPGYLDTLHRVSDRQIALAGLRLADCLNAAPFPPVSLLPATATAPTPPAVTAQGSAPDGATGPIIGNKRTHIYHVGDDGHLPAEKNRVYFQTEDEAQKAGYHKPGGG